MLIIRALPEAATILRLTDDMTPWPMSFSPITPNIVKLTQRQKKPTRISTTNRKVRSAQVPPRSISRLSAVTHLPFEPWRPCSIASGIEETVRPNADADQAFTDHLASPQLPTHPSLTDVTLPELRRHAPTRAARTFARPFGLTPSGLSSAVLYFLDRAEIRSCVSRSIQIQSSFFLPPIGTD
jgi:hypothetical protein